MIIFYRKSDKEKEPISRTKIFTKRIDAANYFAKLKNLSLKQFLELFTVEKIE